MWYSRGDKGGYMGVSSGHEWWDMQIDIEGWLPGLY